MVIITVMMGGIVYFFFFIVLNFVRNISFFIRISGIVFSYFSLYPVIIHIVRIDFIMSIDFLTCLWYYILGNHF